MTIEPCSTTSWHQETYEQEQTTLSVNHIDCHGETPRFSTMTCQIHNLVKKTRMCLTLHGEQCLSGTYMVTCFAKGTERANVYKSKLRFFFRVSVSRLRPQSHAFARRPYTARQSSAVHASVGRPGTVRVCRPPRRPPGRAPPCGIKSVSLRVSSSYRPA